MKLQTKNKELFVKLGRHDKYSFEQIYRLYFPRLYAYANKIIDDDFLAKDVIQNIFVKIWENPKVLNTENPEAFLFKMVRNASLNYVRHLKVVDNLKIRAKENILGQELYHIDFMGNEPVILIEKELEKKIHDVLNTLPPKCKEVFSLSRNEGLKNSEIAEKLNISIKSVEKHISKALAVYRKHFAELIPLKIFLLVLSQL